MTLKEHYRYWLQDHEFLMIKQRNHRLIKQVEEFDEQQLKFGNSSSSGNSSGNINEQQQHRSLIRLVDDNCGCGYRDVCIRGLESGLTSVYLRRKSYQFAALEEVFVEQEEQYFGGYYDDEAIAEVYFEVACECRFRAEYTALQDRKEIEEYVREGINDDYCLDDDDDDDDDDAEFAIQ